MHRRAKLGERIGGPVPSVGRLEHHLRRLAGTGHHLSQHVTVVENPYRLQMFAGLAHPHQHRAASMQIHTDKLPTLIEFAHRGLLRRNNVSTPKHARSGRTRGAEAPLLHDIKTCEKTRNSESNTNRAVLGLARMPPVVAPCGRGPVTQIVCFTANRHVVAISSSAREWIRPAKLWAGWPVPVVEIPQDEFADFADPQNGAC